MTATVTFRANTRENARKRRFLAFTCFFLLKKYDRFFPR